jgi:superfamily II DNA/RNA helicase
MAYGPQLRAFERGVDVVVATPAADRPDGTRCRRPVAGRRHGARRSRPRRIWASGPPSTTSTPPRDGQRLLFSATLDEAIDALVKRYLTDPVTHEVDPETASVGTMTHTFWVIAPHHKNELTARVAGRGGRTLVFVRTQLGADRVATQLRAAGVLAGALHGGLSQGARSRILAAFKEGTLPVLVATDVAARGIHVDDVSVVLQLDPPMTSKDYLHRSGRTARAGESGTVVSLVLPHQRRTVLRLAGQAGAKPQLVQVDPSAEAVVEVAGEWSDRPHRRRGLRRSSPEADRARRPRTPFRKFRGGDRR